MILATYLAYLVVDEGRLIIRLHLGKSVGRLLNDLNITVSESVIRKERQKVFVCLFVCLSVCRSVCLSAFLHITIGNIYTITME